MNTYIHTTAASVSTVVHLAPYIYIYIHTHIHTHIHTYNSSKRKHSGGAFSAVTDNTDEPTKKKKTTKEAKTK